MTEELNDLISGLEASLAAIFLAAILLWRTGIDYLALVAALRDRDVEGALYALHIDRDVFSDYSLERQSAFAKVGAVEADALTKDKTAFFKKRDRETRTLPGLPGGAPQPTARAPDFEPPRTPAPVRPTSAPAAPTAPAPTVPPTTRPPAPPTLAAPGGGSIMFRFDMTNPRAETKIRTEAAARITGYVAEQIETARRVIADGFQRGEGPQTIATDITGRINPISGRREGGIVGLSDPQVDYVENMRRRLLSSDPDEMLKVLGRFDKDGKWVEGTGQTLRDRRFDPAIKKAIRDVAAGKPNPLTGEKIDEMTAKYSDRLLKRRAEDIARTETAQGVEMARAEATKQALAKDGLPDDAVTKEWIHQGGIRHARDGHLAMNGSTVVGTDTPFFLPDGSVMLYPHDPDGGVKNNANCRCRGEHAIDWAFGI
jgi:hypothetical protein